MAVKDPLHLQLPLFGEAVERRGQDERNLAEYPLTLLSDRAPVGQQIRKQEWEGEGDNGKPVKCSWTLAAATGKTLPLASDESVYIVLMEMTLEQGNEDPVVVFSRNDLCDRLGWPHKGDSYRRLEDSIRRLNGVTITAKNLYRGADGTLFPEVGFHLISDYAFADERKTKGTARSYIRWSDMMWESIQTGCLKPIDVGFYLSLTTATARRLFKYLDKKRYLDTRDGVPRYRRQFQIRLRKLAHEHMFMSADRTAEMRRQLDAAHEELIERGFLGRVDFTETKGGEAMAVYYFAAGALKPPSRSKKSLVAGNGRKSPEENATAREAQKAEREALDVYLEDHPEVVEKAREITRRKLPRAKDGSKAFEAAVHEEARVMAHEALGG